MLVQNTNRTCRIYITCPLVDTNFNLLVFKSISHEWAQRARTSEISDYRHSKIKFVSTCGHVISSIIPKLQLFFSKNVMRGIRNRYLRFRKISQSNIPHISFVSTYIPLFTGVESSAWNPYNPYHRKEEVKKSAANTRQSNLISIFSSQSCI